MTQDAGTLHLAPDGSGSEPWQLKMFSKSLKKRQKLALLLRQIGDTDGKDCLLITNGDNNGALNWHFRAHGGRWTWVENEDETIAEMQDLLGDPVLRGAPERIPVADASFDVVVTIDVHEHLPDCTPFGRELFRVTRPGGTVVVTTPSGDERKVVTRLKNAVGMTKERYGHHVIGYTVAEHERMLEEVGLRPIASGGYSRFFTELIELAVNYAFVMVLGKKKKVEAKEGQIAPTTGSQLSSVKKQFRIWSAVFPILWLVSRLDVLDLSAPGYAVSVVGRRPS